MRSEAGGFRVEGLVLWVDLGWHTLVDVGCATPSERAYDNCCSRFISVVRSPGHDDAACTRTHNNMLNAIM